jgi:hypothetical protein
MDTQNSLGTVESKTAVSYRWTIGLAAACHIEWVISACRFWPCSWFGGPAADGVGCAGYAVEDSPDRCPEDPLRVLLVGSQGFGQMGVPFRVSSRKSREAFGDAGRLEQHAAVDTEHPTPTVIPSNAVLLAIAPRTFQQPNS